MKELEDLANWLTKRSDDRLRANVDDPEEGCALADIPANLTTFKVLSMASGAGVIEFGRRNYSTTKKLVGEKCTYGKLPGEKTLHEEYRVYLDSGYNWSDLKGKGDIRPERLLAEDSKLKAKNYMLAKKDPNDAEEKDKPAFAEISLRVRLTQDWLEKLDAAMSKVSGKQLAGV